MSQKSILSFFKSSGPTTSSSPTEKKQEIENSPVKSTRSKRKVQRIESDDESLDNSTKSRNGKSGQTKGDAKNKKSPQNVSVKEKKEKQMNGVSKSKKSPKQKKKSEEEEENVPSNSLNDESEEANEDTRNKKSKLSSDSSPKVSAKKKNEKQVNGVSKSKKSPRQRKKKEEEESPSTNTSNDEDNMSDKEQKCPEADKSEDTSSEPSVSSNNSHAESIPKRKTARKQFNSAKNTKANGVFQREKGESDSKVSLNVKESKKDIDTNDNTASQSEETDVEMKDNENYSSDSDVKQSSNACSKADSERKPENKRRSSNVKKSDSKPKGRNSKGKVESNSKITQDVKESKKCIDTKDNATSQCKEVDVEMKDVENDSSNADNKQSSAACNETESDKKPENKSGSSNVKIFSDAKPKGRNSKGKKSPIKKSAATGIQSFFAPLKKTEDNKKEEMAEKAGDDKKSDVKMETEDKSLTKAENESKKDNERISRKRQKAESDDSPVKKAAKRKKKIQSLESDDETEDKPLVVKEISKKAGDDDSPVKNVAKQKKKAQSLESDDEAENISVPVEENVKMETEEVEENCSVSAVKNEENSSISEKTDTDIESEKKASPIKKSEDADSKSSKEKQKLGIKSTASGTVYNPSKNNYHPIEDACWKKGEKVPYLALAKTMEFIENTSGRLKTIEILANFFRSVIVLSPDDLLQSVYLCLNRIAPEYEGIELGVGETLLMKAVAQATGRTLDKIKAEVAAKGDLGLVSESSRGNQRVMFAPPKLTVSSVFSKFFEIAKMSGNSSMAKKTDKIQSLFVACRECEARYIIRSLSGKLRIGLAEQSILSAIAQAATRTPPGQTYPPEVIDASKKMSSDSFKELVDTQALILKTAYCECPNYDLIIPVLLKEGISALPDHCQLSPGTPLKPMLAHPTAGIDKVLERFDKNAFTCEFKYDGERAQIHMTDKGDVKIFSRNQEDNTSKYPDVISRITNALKETTKSFILDSEAVAWDKATKQILPFQVLSTRKKKDAVESEIVVQVCIMAFDLLYLNGESLVKKPLKERRNLLHSSFNEVENEFMFAQYKDGNSAETMQEFLDESVKGNCEGLMVKALEVDASYEIAKRSHNWLKLKKDYLQGIGDTLDLVVIGGYYGKGKRTGNYGGFLLACYDEDNEEYQSICKLGTGFKDETLDTHTTFLKQHVIPNPKSYYRYDHSLEPDVWFEPVQVWEIKCADLSISPVHKAAAGIVDPEKGISLRFPRFIRIREDKTPENATNSVQIADMYQKQDQIQNTTNKSTKVDEDCY